jgi:hypothetical protein
MSLIPQNPRPEMTKPLVLQNMQNQGLRVAVRIGLLAVQRVQALTSASNRSPLATERPSSEPALASA